MQNLITVLISIVVAFAFVKLWFKPKLDKQTEREIELIRQQYKKD